MTKDEALRLALDALYGFIPYLPLEHEKPQCDRYDQAITTIKAALEAKDEPVVGTKTWFEDGKVVTQNLYYSDVYITPAQRTWVGLTDDEIRAFIASNKYAFEIVKAAEAKLKEKNT